MKTGKKFTIIPPTTTDLRFFPIEWILGIDHICHWHPMEQSLAIILTHSRRSFRNNFANTSLRRSLIPSDCGRDSYDFPQLGRAGHSLRYSVMWDFAISQLHNGSDFQKPTSRLQVVRKGWWLNELHIIYYFSSDINVTSVFMLFCSLRASFKSIMCFSSLMILYTFCIHGQQNSLLLSLSVFSILIFQVSLQTSMKLGRILV